VEAAGAGGGGGARITGTTVTVTAPVIQGLTLDHCSAQRSNFLVGHVGGVRDSNDRGKSQ